MTTVNRHLTALNIPEFLYAENANTPVAKMGENTTKIQCLVLETQLSQSFCKSGDSQDLLLKMLTAIGLSTEAVVYQKVDAVADIEKLLTQFDAQAVLLMSDTLKSTKSGHFTTHHPSLVLADETLKREVWEVLKNLKAYLAT